jgi:hypothetical protein
VLALAGDWVPQKVKLADNLSLWTILLLTLLSLHHQTFCNDISAESFQSPTAMPLIVSEYDQRTYRLIKLENELEVMLIHDDDADKVCKLAICFLLAHLCSSAPSETFTDFFSPRSDEKAGAAMDVRSGSWKDPHSTQGLAHFCGTCQRCASSAFPLDICPRLTEPNLFLSCL